MSIDQRSKVIYNIEQWMNKKHSLHEKTAASVLLKLFISSNDHVSAHVYFAWTSFPSNKHFF